MKNIKTFEQFNQNDMVEERFLGMGKTDLQKMEKEYNDKVSPKEIINSYFKQALKLSAIRNKVETSDESVLSTIITDALKDPDGRIGTIRYDFKNKILKYIPVKDADKKLKGKGGAITGSGLT